MRVTLEKSHASSARSASAIRRRRIGSASRRPLTISEKALGVIFRLIARSTCRMRRAASVVFRLASTFVSSVPQKLFFSHEGQKYLLRAGLSESEP